MRCRVSAAKLVLPWLFTAFRATSTLCPPAHAHSEKFHIRSFTGWMRTWSTNWLSTTMRWYAHSVGWRDLSGLKRSLYTYTSCCFFLMKVRHRPETVGYKVQRECRVKFCPELQHSFYQYHPPTRVDYASNLFTQLESQRLFHHSIFYHCPAIRSNLS